MKKSLHFLLVAVCATTFCLTSCKSSIKTPEMETPKSPVQIKVEEFAYVDLVAPELIAQLSEKEKQIIPIFIEVAEIIDSLFWMQTFGDRAILDTITCPYVKDFTNINYGPWEHLNNNTAFVNGFGVKPLGCQYYPLDMTPEEYAAFEDPNKGSLYTIIKRNEAGELYTVWYKDAFKPQIERICALLDQAIELAEDHGLRNYLLTRKEAFLTDDYFASDLAWMDMKDSKLDFVVGPIENYDDALNNAKAAYEAFILIKDVERSEDLAKFVALLPQLQTELPCPAEYKTFVPGTSSDLNVYNAVYYAGDCNAGSKTIAINLPNDDRVQALKGARRLQLRNSMQAKFDKILLPIGKVVLVPEQQDHLKFDAFFWNVTFHEVAHGLGIKTTINGKGSVDQAMANERTAWEEAKADILGLFMVTKLIEKQEITDITVEDAITTYIAGILRSVRFGSASSHGTANMMCFNYFEKEGAFARNEEGLYVIDYEKAKGAMNHWAELIIKTQGDGNYEFAKSFRAENGGITPLLQADLDKINSMGIPRDVRFNQGVEVMGL